MLKKFSFNLNAVTASGKSLNIPRTLDTSLLVLNGGLVIYIMYQLLLSPQLSPQAFSKNIIPPQSKNSLGLLVAETKPFSYYAERFGGKDIFQITPVKIPGQEAVAASTDNPSETHVPQNQHNPLEFIKNLKLVGIVMDGNSTAIVENSETQETAFLHEGNSFKEASVKEIQKGKIVFDYFGQGVELVP